MANITTHCEKCHWQQANENERLCPNCNRELENNLAWFENHTSDLQWRANRADKTGNGGGTHGGYSASPAPLRESVHELIDGPDKDGNPGLTDILREYCHCLGINTTYTATPDTMARRIRLSYKRAANAATPTYALILNRLRRQAEQLLDYTLEDKVIVGNCPTQGCTHVVTAVRTAQFAPVCPECGQVYPVSVIREKRREKLLHSNIAGTQTELRKLLLQCDIIVKPGTIRSWVSRGDLKPIEPHTDRRKSKYRLADVYQLAVQNPEQETSIWMLLRQEEQER